MRTTKADSTAWGEQYQAVWVGLDGEVTHLDSSPG